MHCLTSRTAIVPLHHAHSARFDTFGGLSIGIKVFTAASQGNPSRLLFNSAWHGVQPRRKKSASHKVTFCPDSLLVKGDVQVRGYQR